MRCPHPSELSLPRTLTIPRLNQSFYSLPSRYTLTALYPHKPVCFLCFHPLLRNLSCFLVPRFVYPVTVLAPGRSIAMYLHCCCFCFCYHYRCCCYPHLLQWLVLLSLSLPWFCNVLCPATGNPCLIPSRTLDLRTLYLAATTASGGFYDNETLLLGPDSRGRVHVPFPLDPSDLSIKLSGTWSLLNSNTRSWIFLGFLFLLLLLLLLLLLGLCCPFLEHVA